MKIAQPSDKQMLMIPYSSCWLSFSFHRKIWSAIRCPDEELSFCFEMLFLCTVFFAPERFILPRSPSPVSYFVHISYFPIFYPERLKQSYVFSGARHIYGIKLFMFVYLFAFFMRNNIFSSLSLTLRYRNDFFSALRKFLAFFIPLHNFLTFQSRCQREQVPPFIFRT